MFRFLAHGQVLPRGPSHADLPNCANLTLGFVAIHRTLTVGALSSIVGRIQDCAVPKTPVEFGAVGREEIAFAVVICHSFAHPFRTELCLDLRADRRGADRTLGKGIRSMTSRERTRAHRRALLEPIAPFPWLL